jgi:general secretion pathway protein A
VQPPASFRALADPIYEAFYGLTDQPFAITTDPKFFYLSTSHERAYSQLLNGLRRREGIVLVTGDTGTGKTTLCRAVLESLGSRTFASMILNPYLTAPEILRLVLRDFGLVSQEDLTRGRVAAAGTAELVAALESFLRSLSRIDSQAVIVLDEAQSLAPEVLDQIRVLTAVEQDNRRLLSIVLCGQPPLADLLDAEPLRALKERITRRVALEPLAHDEVEAYIHHRLSIVGGTNAVGFGPEAAAAVADLAGGLPRRINVVCDRALEEGRHEGVQVITADLVRRAGRSVGFAASAAPQAPAIAAVSSEPTLAPAPSLLLGQIGDRPPQRPWTLVAMSGAAAALLFAGYTYYAERALSDVAVLPAPPPPAAQDAPSSALPPPPDAEFLRLLVPRRIGPPPTPVPSGELPGNPNEFN